MFSSYMVPALPSSYKKKKGGEYFPSKNIKATAIYWGGFDN
jgi:hypothetical protein